MKHLLLFILLSGCGQEYLIKGEPNDGPIFKLGQIAGPVGEITPIVLNDNVYLISFNQNDVEQGFIQVQSFPDYQILSRTPFPYNFGSAIVENGVVHVFGSSNTALGPGNHIVMSTSTDLLNWTPPVTILTAPSNQTLYNSSVAKGPSGFVMTYEVHEEDNTAWFLAQFLSSSDLLNWTPIGTRFDPKSENACPTIRYSNGYWYLFTMHDRGSVINSSRYYTSVARSTDLINFEESPIEVLNSYGRTDEGINNSDIDMVEYHGKMIFVYLVGNQIDFAYMKLGSYNGTFDEFIGQFFP